MNAILDPSADVAIAWLRDRMRSLFGDRFIGLYLYGSAVYGDFDAGVSDLDFVCALKSDVSDAELDHLGRMHDALVARWPEWRDRIEVQYVAIERVRRFREARFTMANISPGEPLHRIESGTEWLMNWYFAVHYSRTIAGPPPATIFPAIASEEFVQSARDHAREWLGRIEEIGGSHSQSYSALTMSRALYTHQTGRHVSKAAAARWLADRHPAWAPTLTDALAWRRQPDFPAPETVERARAFVRFVAAAIAGGTRR